MDPAELERAQTQYPGVEFKSLDTGLTGVVDLRGTPPVETGSFCPGYPGRYELHVRPGEPIISTILPGAVGERRGVNYIDKFGNRR